MAALALVTPLLMAPTCGEQVIIPAVDETPPFRVSTYIKWGDEYLSGTTMIEPDTLLLPGDTFEISPVGWDDDGGVRLVESRVDTLLHCERDGELFYYQPSLGSTVQEKQSGRPGVLAWTGLGTTVQIDPSDFRARCPGYTSSWRGTEIRFWTAAWNFAGEETVADMRSLFFAPPS